MKLLLLFLVGSVSLLSLRSNAQKLTVNFIRKVDTIRAGSDTEIPRTDSIIVPKQSGFNNQKIKVSILKEKTNFPDSSLYFSGNEYTIDSSRTDTFYVHSIIKRTNKYDRTLTLQITLIDASNNAKQLSEPITKEIFIGHFTEDSLEVSKRYQFWLFTGTNLDLIDGLQLQDLYFRADYLLKLKGKRSWLFFTFGKSRFFDNTDSIYHSSYSNYHLSYKSADSIELMNGLLDARQVLKTENIFIGAKYLYKVKSLSYPGNDFFVSLGAEIQYLTITKSFNNVSYVPVLDSVSLSVDTLNSLIYHPIATRIFNEWDYDINAGIFHVLNLNGFNIKTQLSLGLNIFQCDSVHITEGQFPDHDNVLRSFNFYQKLNIDATVLNPGISLGFEIFTSYRSPDPQILRLVNNNHKILQPLFNVSLTKVFDLSHISSLFTALPTTNL